MSSYGKRKGAAGIDKAWVIEDLEQWIERIGE